jgi:hypothetical protein
VNPPFQFTPLATEDLDSIWWFIAEHNREAAGRVGGGQNTEDFSLRILCGTIRINSVRALRILLSTWWTILSLLTFMRRSVTGLSLPFFSTGAR